MDRAAPNSLHVAAYAGITALLSAAAMIFAYSWFAG